MSAAPRQWQVNPRAVWAGAAGFWVFVAAISAAQFVWVARTPGQRADIREGIVWQTTYLLSWIPFTIALLHVTRGWLPERFGGWGRLLIAHLPLFVGVALAHSFVVTLLARAFAHENLTVWPTFLRQLRGQLT